MTKSRTRIFSLILLLLAAGLLVAIELGTKTLLARRRIAVETLLFASGPLESYGEDLGWSLNAFVDQRIRTGFGDLIAYRTGRHGFRVAGGDARAETDVDVLFVGDSVTFGTGANTSFPLEFARLSRVKAVNAGVPGYGTDQAFLMARQTIEVQGARPKRVVYGFYHNDLANNVSEVATDFDEGLIVHKPRLDHATWQYLRARVEANDLTKRYREPSVGEASQLILSQSSFLLAAGRVLKYNLGLGCEPQRRAPIEFSDAARRALEANLDQSVGFLRPRGVEFNVVHVRGGQVALEDTLAQWLSTFCSTRRLQCVFPQLEATDYLPTDFHLSDTGAVRVAAALQAAFH